MQILIQKTSLVRLEAKPHSLRVGLGDPVQLVQDEGADIAVLVSVPSWIPFGLGKPWMARLGYLDTPAQRLLMPAVRSGAPLRVRIVEIEVAHLNTHGAERISVSVWGEGWDVSPIVARPQILSRSRIHDDPSTSRGGSDRSSSPADIPHKRQR